MVGWLQTTIAGDPIMKRIPEHWYLLVPAFCIAVYGLSKAYVEKNATDALVVFILWLVIAPLWAFLRHRRGRGGSYLALLTSSRKAMPGAKNIERIEGTLTEKGGRVWHIELRGQIPVVGGRQGG